MDEIVLPPTGRSAWVELARAFGRSAAFGRWARARHVGRPIPPLAVTPRTVTGVLADELLSTAFVLRSRHETFEAGLMLAELEDAVAALRAGGYLDDPMRIHPAPPAPDDTHSVARRVGGLRFEHLSFQSLYIPPPGLPRTDEWLADESNRVAHAYLLRHGDDARPWVVVLHGLSMGEPVDLWLLGSRKLFGALGANVAHVVLPLHGPRSRATTLRRFPSLDSLGNLYGLSQAMWDCRKVIAWIRARGATDVAVWGVSLGGHAAALLAAVEPGLAGVVAGVPTTDYSTLFARHLSRYWNDEMLAATHVLEEPHVIINGLVSPLTFRPLVAQPCRFIYAAVGDRLVTPEQAAALWRHWDECEILWVQGSHLLQATRSTRRFVVRSLERSGIGREHQRGG